MHYKAKNEFNLCPVQNNTLSFTVLEKYNMSSPESVIILVWLSGLMPMEEEYILGRSEHRHVIEHHEECMAQRDVMSTLGDTGGAHATIWDAAWEQVAD